MRSDRYVMIVVSILAVETTLAAEPAIIAMSGSRLTVSATTGEFDWLLGDLPAALRYQGKLAEGKLRAQILDENGVVVRIDGLVTAQAMDFVTTFEGLGQAHYQYSAGSEPFVVSEDMTAAECTQLTRMPWISQASNVMRIVFDRLPPTSEADERLRVAVVLSAFDFVAETARYLEQCREGVTAK